MAVLFFLPWASIDEEIQIEGLRFIPYSRGESPLELRGIPLATLDAVLESYGNQVVNSRQGTSLPIAEATLLLWDDEATDELSEDTIYARLSQLNYVAFAALSRRRFGQGIGYCNADGYRAIAQRFVPDEPGGICLNTRRRDGHGSHYVTPTGIPVVIRPEHVDGFVGFDPDLDLLGALLRLPDGDLKLRIDESIDSFLRANTDSPSMNERSEMVLMLTAFETILESNHTKEELRRKISEHFQNDLPDPPVWSTGPLSRTVWTRRWMSNANRPLDAWSQDFSASRNAAAHRRQSRHSPAIWQSHNHLLFSSWLLPLMIKKYLADQGLYTLSFEDRASREMLEIFLVYDLLAYCDADQYEVWWTRLESQIRFRVIANRIYPDLDRE